MNKFMAFWEVLCFVTVALVGVVLLAVGFVLVDDKVQSAYAAFLKRQGRKARGIIIESEQYTGDGLHGADPCFRGKFTFADHRGKLHHGKFARYCFEPSDFAHSALSFAAVAKTFETGASIDVYYLGWFPFIHTENPRWPSRDEI